MEFSILQMPKISLQHIQPLLIIPKLSKYIFFQFYIKFLSNSYFIETHTVVSLSFKCMFNRFVQHFIVMVKPSVTDGPFVH